jgi:hypothetical protein
VNKNSHSIFTQNKKMLYANTRDHNTSTNIDYTNEVYRLSMRDDYPQSRAACDHVTLADKAYRQYSTRIEDIARLSRTEATDPLTHTITAFEFFVLQTTWRWPPIGVETCSVRSAQ